MASVVRLCAVDIGGPQLPISHLYQLIMRTSPPRLPPPQHPIVHLKSWRSSSLAHSKSNAFLMLSTLFFYTVKLPLYLDKVLYLIQTFCWTTLTRVAFFYRTIAS